MSDQQLTINISTGALIKVVTFVLVAWLLYLVRDILLLVFVAVVLAALIEPLVDRLQAHKIPRAVGVIGIYVVLLLIILILARLIIPPIVSQVSSLTDNFPQFWQQTVENFESVRAYSEQQGFLDNVQRGLEGVEGSLSSAAGSVYGLIKALFRNVVNFILLLVLTFYLVVQRDALATVLKALTPSKYHAYINVLTVKIKDKIGAWARGQLILALVIGLLSFIGLLIFLPKYALVLAIIAGAVEIIPYVGPTLGAIPAVFLGFTVSFGHGIAVLILYVVIQQLENHFIVPQVMRRQVGLNPVVIIVAMLIGARLAGIIGVILAVPIATAVRIITRDALERVGGGPSMTTEEAETVDGRPDNS